jgi:NO-binding membrane sensor protein with MHYT domain
MNEMMAGTYNYWLVALSFGIAVLMSPTAIAQVERVPDSASWVGRVWPLVSSIAVAVLINSVGLMLLSHVRRFAPLRLASRDKHLTSQRFENRRSDRKVFLVSDGQPGLNGR